MSIFPFIDASGVTDTKKVTDLPLLKEYAYDYAKNELLLDENGCTYLVEGNAALRIWIFKALTTARFRHVAYSPAFGEEYEDQLIGHMTMSVLSDKQEITVQMLPGIKPERSGCFRLNTGRNR